MSAARFAKTANLRYKINLALVVGKLVHILYHHS